MVAQDELGERLLSYARHHIAKGPAGMGAVIQKGHDQLLGVLDGLSDEQAKFKSTPDDWCILEVLRHVEESKVDIARRCAELVRGEKAPHLTGVGSMRQKPFTSLAQARAGLDAGHAELLAFVASVSPDMDTETTYDHPWFGPLNCLEWAIFHRLHESDHISQIEQTRLAPGFP